MSQSINEYKRLNTYRKDRDFLQNSGSGATEHYAYDLSRNIITDGESYDEYAIAQSIENIVLTGYGERIFEPSFGSGITSIPFSRADSRLLNTALDTLIDRIEKTDYRVSIMRDRCKMIMDPDNNQVTLEIVFFVKSNYKVGVFSRTLAY